MGNNMSGPELFLTPPLLLPRELWLSREQWEKDGEVALGHAEEGDQAWQS